MNTASGNTIEERPALASAALVCSLALTGCGEGGEDPAAGADVSEAADAAVQAAAEATDEDSIDEATSMAEDVTDDAEDMVEDMKDSLEEQQAAQGGGAATFTAGDQTWTFDKVLCAIGEEETGQEGAELVLTSLQDGLQLYVTIDAYGHSVTLDDVEDFENPAVSLSTYEQGDFIELDGQNVSGQMTITDGLTSEELEASLEGTCP